MNVRELIGRAEEASKRGAGSGFDLNWWRELPRERRLQLARSGGYLAPPSALVEIWKAESRSVKIRGALLQNPAAPLELLELAWEESKTPQGEISHRSIELVCEILRAERLSVELYREIAPAVVAATASSTDYSLSLATLQANINLGLPLETQGALLTGFPQAWVLPSLLELSHRSADEADLIDELAVCQLRARPDLVWQMVEILEIAAIDNGYKKLIDQQLEAVIGQRATQRVGRDHVIFFAASAIRAWRSGRE